MTKAHQKYVVGGTRGQYASAYSYVTYSLPNVAGESDDRTEPLEESNPFARLQIGTSNANPIFEYPVGSRVFNAEMRVFPNPSTGNINVGGAIEPGALLRVVNPMGQLILEQRIQPGETEVQLELPKVAPGMYQVEMIGEKGLTTRKVIVQ